MDLSTQARLQFSFEDIGGDAQEQHSISFSSRHFRNRPGILDEGRIRRNVDILPAGFVHSYPIANIEDKTIAVLGHAGFQPQLAGRHGGRKNDGAPLENQNVGGKRR